MRKLAISIVPLLLLACNRDPVTPPLPHLSANRSADVQEIPDVVVGAFIGSCQGFDVLSDWSAVIRVITQYDGTGNPRREVELYHVQGQSRYYNSQRPDLAVYGGPSETQNVVWEYDRGVILLAGPVWRVVLPSAGPVLMDIGEVTLDLAAFLNGQFVITHSGGHHQWWEGDFGALCDALTP